MEKLKLFRPFQRGDRIRVKSNAGFSRDATGVIEYVTPNGEIWVMRDGATSATYFHRPELEYENEEDGHVLSESALTEALSHEDVVKSPFWGEGVHFGWNLARKVIDEAQR